MKRTIFYSWQSDTTSKWNRNLIEEALERALKAIRKDDEASVEPVLDRDTAGVGGSPAITDTIFRKISTADVFVADVTTVNHGDKDRLIPNPNVSLELGYAIARLGWGRILLVQNAVHGGPEDLPFDLRGRRVIGYAADDTNDRAEVRALLQGRLEAALREALTASMIAGVHAGPDVPIWWGHWNKPDRHVSSGGHLFIREVGTEGFLFDMEVFNGSHMGAISGFARIVSSDLAYARIPAGDDGKFCELTFKRSLEGGNRRIEVEEAGEGHHFHGMGASFTGRYEWKYYFIFDGGFLDELDLQRLYRLTGQYFDLLMNCFAVIGQDENKDTFVASVIWGGVRGLYTITEGIILRGARAQLWVAYLYDDVVRYFTTERAYLTELPKTIEHWRSRFADKVVIYDSPVVQIPPDL